MRNASFTQQNPTEAPARLFNQINFLWAAIVVVALSAVILHLQSRAQVIKLQEEVSSLNSALDAATQQTAQLQEAVASTEARTIEQLAETADELRNEIVRTASAKLDHSIGEALSELHTYGNAQYVFHMVANDRRSCVKGGVFIGELSDGSLQEAAFNAGEMVAIEPSHTDIRGIPFYRAKISASLIETRGDAAAFRHGTMRIACN
ncbi:hypothetical protein [Hoeflea prorocentri]|uniref:Uncharacterized protein n=1 Tax=Hoeflea prorocentri TaxID=1922333 RepID=A0A9X3ZID6_9HYPH|nr:hypothetical protein [Hoeflea prorocentri]MCY6381615.1 hypothetical protein [Hoeflea prorocentri]MDA5399415.1 hypothetical protein [Hoeflea prorocentri]